ncbi:MAG: hypothetical protein RL703_814 [Pseudomonadota bacterium]
MREKKRPPSLEALNLARSERFELPTPWFVAKYSIQMSYERVETETIHKAEDGCKGSGYNIGLYSEPHKKKPHHGSRTA